MQPVFILNKILSTLILFFLANYALFSLAQNNEKELNKTSDSTKKKITSEEIIVSSTTSNKSAFESAQSISIINKNEILTKNVSSIGVALQNELGVVNSNFGAGANRPVIRGLGQDRIRILQNGVGTNDVSNTSPDHPVNLDLLNADQIEILRGPSALRFGTTAVGGVINVIDNKIPERLPDGLIEGDVNFLGATNNLERSGGFRATSKASENIVINIETANRKSDNYRVGESRGKLEDSDNQYNTVSLGSSYIKEDSFIGISGSYQESRYGVPTDDEDISIGMHQPRLDIRGKLAEPTDFLRYISVNSTLSDYKHTEFEEAKAGTAFKNKGSDTRFEIAHKPFADFFTGILGLQTQTSRLRADGQESYIPPSSTDIFSVYLLEEVPLVKELLTIQAGLRTDFQNSKTEEFSRTFDTLSQSAGLVYNPVKNYSLGLSVARTERAPVAQELFANGPHLATNAFEIGNNQLDPERSLGIDLSLKRKDGLVTGSIGGFSNRFSNYIGLNPTGEKEDDLAVFIFESQRAQFYGVESILNFHFWGQTEESRKQDDLTFYVQQDWVWAKDIDTSSPLPRIPPYRVRAGMQIQKESLGARLEITRTNSQNRVSPQETSTDGFTFLNAYLTKDVNVWSYDFPAQIFLSVENITNEFAQNHVSFIKDTVPLMGRNFMAGIKISF